MPFDFTQNTPPVTIVDRPCGFGKSSNLIAGLSPDTAYLIVVPLKAEVTRFIRDAPIELVEPITTAEGGKHHRKRDHLRELLIEGRSIVTTHALFTDIAYLAKEGLLLSHHVIVDEVLNVAECVTSEAVVSSKARDKGVTMASWKGLYIDHGFADVDPETGLVTPTAEWHLKSQLPELSERLYKMASVESLFAVGDNVLVWELPPVLLKAVASLKVLTFMAEGSMMAAFMRRHGVDYVHDIDTEAEAAFREAARKLIEVRNIPALNAVNFSHSAQSTISQVDAKKVAGALKNIRERLMRGVPKDNIMITCSKANWFANPASSATPRPGKFSSGSRLFDGPNYVPNTTRGTNDFQHVTHLVYLFNQNVNPRIAEFLDVQDLAHREAYAISELLQWVYRSQVRRGQPIVLYIPSKRMRRLFERWLDGDL